MTAEIWGVVTGACLVFVGMLVGMWLASRS